MARRDRRIWHTAPHVGAVASGLRDEEPASPSGSRPRVLFAPETFNAGEVTRGVEVAKRLADRVECVFAGFSERNRELIEGVGFELRLLSPRLDDEDARALLALDQGRGLRNPFTDEMLSARVASERALIAELGVSAVVIGATLSQLISARAEGVPLVFIRPFAYSLAHVEAMRRSGATGVLGRRGVGRAAVDHLVARLAPFLAGAIGLPPVFRRVASAHGVVLPRGIAEAMTADLNLISTPEAMLPGWVSMPAGHSVVGPVYASLPGELPDVVTELASRDGPVIYVAMGSSGDRELVLAILHGLGGAGYEVLAPVREHLEPADCDGLAPTVHVTGRLPADRLGDVVDLAITHGGEGTVQTSCVQGWPFIGVPLQAEQRFNVQRCVDLGSARMVRRRQVTAVDWPRLVASALADRRMRERAGRLAERLEALDGPGAAASAILGLV